MIGSSTDFARRLRRWFDQNRRDLPWRLPLKNDGNTKLDPYHVLVSEAMLQQTQVATVIPYFHRFLEQFPTIAALAGADTQQVLRAWQGLGYYSRARNLQASAKNIMSDFGGRIPTTVDELLTLPGVGRYTAGAVSSIAFERRSPILDGNVARVLCRIDAIQTDPREPSTRELLWTRAEQILPKSKIGDFNSAMMELGALICTPRSPQCLLCVVRMHCEANAQGLQEKIPAPRASKPTPLFIRWTFCIRSGDRYLVEQRPASGRWASMWQFVTIETEKSSPSVDLLQSRFSLRTTDPVLLGKVEHSLTHRRYRFDVFTCEAVGRVKGDWLTAVELDQRPMPRPHVKILAMLPKK